MKKIFQVQNHHCVHLCASGTDTCKARLILAGTGCNPQCRELEVPSRCPPQAGSSWACRPKFTRLRDESRISVLYMCKLCCRRRLWCAKFRLLPPRPRSPLGLQGKISRKNADKEICHKRTTRCPIWGRITISHSSADAARVLPALKTTVCHVEPNGSLSQSHRNNRVLFSDS